MIDSLSPEAYPDNIPSYREYLKAFPMVWNIIVNSETKDNHLKIDSKDINGIILKLKAEHEIKSTLSNSKIKRLFAIWVNNHKALIGQSRGTVNTDATIFSAVDGMPKFIYKSMNMHHASVNNWFKYIDGEIKIVPLPGNHFTIMSDQENLIKLSAKFDQELSYNA